MKFLSLLAASALFVTLNAETITYDLQKEFGKTPNAKVEGNILTFKGPGTLRLSSVKLDPSAKYTISMEVKQSGDAKVFPFFCGFYCYDKNGKQLMHENIRIIRNTDTVLAVDAKPGDKTITVKNASAWKNGTWIAFCTKTDYSDIPNRNVVMAGKVIEKKGDVWVVALSAPLKTAYAAGTGVRQHGAGGYVYTTYAGKATSEWKKVTGTVSGINPLENGGYFKRFWPGTDSVCPMVMLNWNWKDRTGEIQIRNLTLTIEK